MIEAYQRILETPVDWDNINRLGHEIYHEAKFEKVDELFNAIMPILNIVYFTSITQWDDRGYAREDLLQDAALEIYRDMTLRWDKFIPVEDFYSYFKILTRNVMLGLVQYHHNYYLDSQFDPDIGNDLCDDLSFKAFEASIHKEEILQGILELTQRICGNRSKYSKVLDCLITMKYIEGNGYVDDKKFKRKMKSSGLSPKELDLLLDHVTYVHRFSYNYYLAKERGESKMIARLDRIISRFDSSTYAVLSRQYGNTVLPEIYAEFGPALTKKFVKLFGNKTITIPDYQTFMDDLVGGSLLSLCNDKDDLYRIAAEYDLPYGKLARIYDRRVKVLKEMGGNL